MTWVPRLCRTWPVRKSIMCSNRKVKCFETDQNNDEVHGPSEDGPSGLFLVTPYNTDRFSFGLV